MNRALLFDSWTEVERYELDEPPRHRFAPSRRQLFKMTGAGIIVLLVPARSRGAEVGESEQSDGGTPGRISAWLHIDGKGLVTVFTGKTEVGQNIRTSLSQTVADELHVPLESVRMVMADTDRVPYDRGTFGSQTTPRMASQLRQVAAAARNLLLEMGAKRLRKPVSDLVLADGRVIVAATARGVGIGQLTGGKKLLQQISELPPVSPADKWTVAGRSAHKVDGIDFVTGRHQFASDVIRPRMLYGKVLRAPGVKATLRAVDTRAAAAMPGVTVVSEGDFVGVTAPDPHRAQLALASIIADWQIDPIPDSDQLYDHLRKNARTSEGRGRSAANHVGSLRDGLARAQHRQRSVYNVAYIAHTPLEPRAAIAEWKGDSLTVWTGTQRPFGVRDELLKIFGANLGLKPEQIRVIVPDTGSGYGGKHTGDAAVEAARLARAAGRPVKLNWTREEEFRWGYYRPAGVIGIQAGVSKDGTITAWEAHNYNSGGSSLAPPYNIANQHTEFHPSDSPMRQGSYRALASTANCFARESHIDDLANAVGMDPLEVRRMNLDDPRMLAVVNAAAQSFDWTGKRKESRAAIGMACGYDKGGYVAACVQLAIDTDGSVRVLRVVQAFECGAIINPDHLRNQIEGAIVQGLGGALFESIQFSKGTVTTARLADYRVPRFRDTPHIETVLLDRKDLPSAGAGETPIVCVAPAIANAIFAATGKRLRNLPLLPTGVLT